MFVQVRDEYRTDYDPDILSKIVNVAVLLNWSDGERFDSSGFVILLWVNYATGPEEMRMEFFYLLDEWL